MGDLMEELCTPRQWAAYMKMMEKNRSFAAVPDEEKKTVIRESIGYGIKRAKELQAEWGVPDGQVLKNMVMEHGLKVERVTTEYPLPYLAEYEAGRKKIVLYSDRIAQVEKTLKTRHPEYFKRLSLTDMCLAHEFFHHLERCQFGAPGRIVRYRSKLFGVLPWNRRSGEASEIAAHTFVQHLLRLEFSTWGFADMVKEIYEQR